MRTGLPEYNISLESITHVSVLSDRIPLWHNGKLRGLWRFSATAQR